MSHLYHGGDPSRVYYGTDTRAQGLLVGIALAAAVRLWGPVRTMLGHRIAIVLGYIGFAYLVFAVLHLDQRTNWLFERGGFLALAAAAAATVFATMQASGGPLHRLLRAAPTRYLGRITYGVYLYHWPIFLVVITPRRMASSPWWVVIGLELTLLVAAASYHFIERPVVERRVPLFSRTSRPTPLRPRWAALSAFGVLGIIIVGLVVAEPPPQQAERSVALPPPPVEVESAVSPSVTTQPRRVLVVGDSLMAQVGAALERYSKDHPDQLVVFNHSQLGCPVARGGAVRVPGGDEVTVPTQCNGWSDAVPVERLTQPAVVSWKTAVEAFRPDVVLAFITPWDVADRRIPEHGFPNWTEVGDDAYDAYVTSEYRAASDLLSSTGARVLWMLGPHLDRPVSPQNDPARIDLLNDLVERAIVGLPRTSTVDYPSWIGPVGAARDRELRGDGMHLSPEGLTEVVPWLLDDVLTRA
jgi:hypothetical protein